MTCHESLATTSNPIFNHLRIEDIFKLMNDGGRIKEFSEYFGDIINMVLVTKLNSGREDFADDIISSLKEKALPEKISVIALCRSVTQASQGNDSWAQHSINQASKIANTVAESSGSQFCLYVNDLLKRIKKYDPSDSRRAYQIALTENARISKQIQSDVPLEAGSSGELGDHYEQIAKDVVVIVDGGGYPQWYRYFDSKEVRTEEPQSISLIDDNQFREGYGQLARNYNQFFRFGNKVDNKEETASVLYSLHPPYLHPLIDALLGVKSDSAQSIHFNDYNQLTDDFQLFPFGDSEDEESVLMLCHLHSPYLRPLIEKDLGIDLQEMSLRSQVHLLRFLQDKGVRPFIRLGIWWELVIRMRKS